MNNLSYSEMKNVFQNKQAPFSYVFLDVVDLNIKKVLESSDGKNIRIATKSIRSIEVLRYLKSKLGSQYTGLMTYHLDEAIYLLKNGFNHCLMGYPQKATLEQLKEIRELQLSGKRLIQMVDSYKHISWLNECGERLDCSFEFCIDIDMSLDVKVIYFGVFRSPLNKLEKCKKLYQYISKLNNVKCIGLMGYEAQVAGVADSSGKGAIYDWILSILKKRSLKHLTNFRQEAVDAMRKHFDVELVNGGGSGSLKSTASDSSVTELTVGSAFYCPHLFDNYKEAFSPSCGYAIEVSRIARDNIITCLGGGYVASGAHDMNKLPKVMLPKNLDLCVNEMFGEVQTPFINKNSELKLEIGDHVFLRHAKAGELMKHFNQILIVRNNQVEKSWLTYRGEGVSYL